jgi:hypothetical protein
MRYFFSEAPFFEPYGAERSRNCEHGRMERRNEQGEDDMHADLFKETGLNKKEL